MFSGGLAGAIPHRIRSRPCVAVEKENCRIGLQMMTGLPGDDDATCLETARRIIALKPDMVRIYPTLVLSGSPLAALYAKGKVPAPVS
ncbi:MAG: hypothetical protein R2874_05125 [Desulfobacterales bacterium]